MGERLLTALGAVAAAVAVICAFALLFHVLDEGGDDAPARTTVIRVGNPGGKEADAGEKASDSSAKAPARAAKASPGAETPVPGGEDEERRSGPAPATPRSGRRCRGGSKRPNRPP